MVSAVNSSSLSGVSGLGSAGTGARAPRLAPTGATLDTTVASNEVGLGSDTSQDQYGAGASDAAAAAFQAQAFAQSAMASGPAAPSDLAMRSRKAAAAYQATTDQANAAGPGAEVQVPGMPPRLASGRMLDLSA